MSVEEKKLSFFEDKLISCKDGQEIDVFLDELDLVCLYFAASWCSPSKIFTNYLISEFYNEVNWEKRQRVEIIYVSVDKNENFEKSIEGMPWLAFPQDHEKVKRFKEDYEITSIPALVVLTPDGQLVTKKGRHDVVKMQEDAFAVWNNHGFEIFRREKQIEEEENKEEDQEDVDESRL